MVRKPVRKKYATKNRISIRYETDTRCAYQPTNQPIPARFPLTGKFPLETRSGNLVHAHCAVNCELRSLQNRCMNRTVTRTSTGF